MKNKFLILIMISMFSTGLALAQDVTPGWSQKPPVLRGKLDTDEVRGYMFGPGDEIAGKVLGEQDYNFLVTVDENGRIEIPFADAPIIAKCKTEQELRVEITRLLGIYLRKPQLSLQTVKKSRAHTSIYGAVQTPARIELSRRATLMELIVAAGGPTEQAGGMVEVFRILPPACTKDDDANFWKAEGSDVTEIPSRVFSLGALNLGREDSNPVILPGDVIHVQKAAPAYITGEVIAPQGILLKEGGTSLMEAIGMISGTTQAAKTKEIKIYRLKPGANPASKERDTIVANLNLIKEGKEKDVMLQPYDIIQVDKTKKSLALTILEFAVGAGKQAISSAATSTGSKVIYY